MRTALKKWKKWLRPLIFVVIGGIAGLFYYHFFGCTNGCIMTSSPFSTMVYMGLLGWMVSILTDKEVGGGCNT